MKKMFVSALIPLFLLSANHSWSQMTEVTGVCTYKIQVRNIVDAADSFSRFIDHVKTEFGPRHWESFVAAADKGAGLSAFDQFGEKSEEIRNSYVILAKEMNSKFETLIADINPDGKLRIEEVKTKMQQTVTCYFTDTVENDLKRLFSLTGREAPPEIGNEVPGPCEIALRSCMASAESTHLSQLMACGFGAGGLARWVGTFWAVLTGGFCLAGVEYNFSNAKWTCMINYADCVGHH